MEETGNTTSNPATDCEICGRRLVGEDCQACHGTGIDIDGNNGAGSSCEWCRGTGNWLVCPRREDAQHQAAYGWTAQVFGEPLD